MCLDIYAPGHSITIPFFHQQIWFEVGHRTLKVITYCDCFVTNEGKSEIEQLRLHFSRFVSPDDVVVCSGSEIPSMCVSSWYGHFDATAGFDNTHSRVSVRLVFEKADEDEYTGRILKGSFRPEAPLAKGEGLIPVAGQKAERFMQHMEEIDLMVLDFHLETPLEVGDTGWVRFRVETPQERLNKKIINLPQSPLQKEPSHFLARWNLLCPLLLRDEVRRKLGREPYRRWQAEVLSNGLDREGTLTRIDDHRVTLVFPDHVQTSDICSYPYETIIPVVPFRVSTSRGHSALHMMTGSKNNYNRDVVSMAKRILHYLRTIYEKATVEHLVNRFGADQQEAIGLLVDAMIGTGVLVKDDSDSDSGSADPSEQPCFLPVAEHDEHARLLDLRRNYNGRDHPDANHVSGMRELHPFRASFSLCWMAYGSRDKERLRWLDGVAQYLEDSRRLPVPRRAVVVACWEYDNYHSPKQVGEIASRLCETLQTNGQFAVTPVFNPTTSDAIGNVVHKVLLDMDGEGTFLFWFVGHGTLGPSDDHLNLLHKASEDERGLEYSQIHRVFQQHPGVDKIVVLDCCHAAMALKESTPARTFIWPTAEETEGANAKAECGIIRETVGVPAGVQNFSYEASAILGRGDPGNPSEQLTCRDLFGEASKDSPCGYSSSQTHPMHKTPIAINAAHEHITLETVLQKVRLGAVE